MRAFIFISCTFLFLSGCRSAKPLESFHTVTDSVTVTISVTERDTVFWTTSDTVSFLFDCDSLFTALSKKPSQDLKGTKNSRLNFSSPDQNRILVQSICDPIAIEARLRDSLITVLSSRSEIYRVVVPKKYTPRHIFALAVFGGLCAAFFIGIAFVRFRKMFF